MVARNFLVLRRTKQCGIGKHFPSPVPEMESLSRYIPKEVKTAVWKRDEGKCTHPGCDSSFGLQYEHIIPFAKGAKSSFENLKLLCPAHNQFSAIQAYGIKKMGTYLGK